MKLLQAKILDSTHLELSQPIDAEPGNYIVISVADDTEEEEVWQETSRKQFLEAYDDQDAIYDHCCPAGVRRHIAGDLLESDAVEDGINQLGCVGRTG